MSVAFNWEKLNRERRVTFVPSQRSRPASQKQIDYIIGLAYQKGQPKPKLPKTMKGAGDLIERLLALPDVNERKQVRLEQFVDTRSAEQRKEVMVELREHFPQLSPMTVNSLIQLFGQIDETGMAFVLDGLMSEETPTATDELVLFILKRFLDEFGCDTPTVSPDENTLVAG